MTKKYYCDFIGCGREMERPDADFHITNAQQMHFCSIHSIMIWHFIDGYRHLDNI
jgi:hypothetical protein